MRSGRDYHVIEKAVGETPLEATERLRKEMNLPAAVPLAYAGRLDPMASGLLLVLVGDACKQQSNFHALDKEYVVEILFGISSDTGDVLGLLETDIAAPQVSEAHLRRGCHNLLGSIKLPYPHYSAKTVQGKPLHTWSVEGRLHEITIPTKTSMIHRLDILSLRTESKTSVYNYATNKIETIPPVTDLRKALGNDFRRPFVRESWQNFLQTDANPTDYTIAAVRCIASSGTYMRTLANEIAKEIGTQGLAYSIHRTKIGVFQSLPLGLGFWKKRYR